MTNIFFYPPPQNDSLKRFQIIDLIALRPRIDLDSDWFISSYASEILALQLKLKLVKDCLNELQSIEDLEVQRDSEQNRKIAFGLFDLRESVASVCDLELVSTSDL